MITSSMGLSAAPSAHCDSGTINPAIPHMSSSFPGEGAGVNLFVSPRDGGPVVMGTHARPAGGAHGAGKLRIREDVHDRVRESARLVRDLQMLARRHVEAFV